MDATENVGTQLSDSRYSARRKELLSLIQELRQFGYNSIPFDPSVMAADYSYSSALRPISICPALPSLATKVLGSQVW